MKNKRFIFLLLFIIRSVWIFACMNSLVLSEGNFRIVVSDGELPPIKLAVETLQRDFKSVMGFRPSIVSVPTDREAGSIELIIVNESTVNPNVDKSELRSLDGFESHRLYADASTKRIYLTGKDMRGAIYAIYTFSEKFLDVPPLWFFSSWRHQKKNRLRSLVILIIFINLHKYVTELGSLMIQNFLRRGGNVHYKITKCG